MKSTPMQYLPEFDTELDKILTIDQSLQELDVINARIKASKNVSQADSLRANSLMAKIAVLKQGISPDSFRRAQMNAENIKQGKRLILPAAELPLERRHYIEAFRAISRGDEMRDVQTSGHGTVSFSNTSGNAFVPTKFIFNDLCVALKSISPLLSPEKVTFISTDSGAGAQIPLADDTSEVAQPVTEAASDTTYTNIQDVSQLMNYTTLYRTPKIKASIEFEGDAALANLHVGLIETFLAARLGRGVSADLINGNGSGRILGLIPSLENNGVTPISAAGSADDTGIVGNTGANSIGLQDLANVYYACDRVYRDSPKAGWLLADSTLNYLDGLKDKMGQKQNVIKWAADGQPRLFGKPVYTDNGMSGITPSAVSVLFGDLSHWMTRFVPAGSYMQRYTEAPGLAENGLIGFALYGRFGGALLSNSVSQSPIQMLRQHS
jgi:HK97 family phage major capsid protein